MNRRQIITTIIAIAAVCSSWAQDQMLVCGSVRDAFLKTPLTDVRVSLFTADSVMVADSIPVRVLKNKEGNVSATQFNISVNKGVKYMFRGQKDGYEDKWVSFELSPDDSGVFFLNENLDMRKIRTVDLSEVTVTATRIKMFYRGDTIVYDATAFKLPQGSMLDDLIRQMPGVTLNDAGEIFVNGKKVDELLLGSRSFMRGNKKVLMENLPYYTVKNLKVYEKQSDRSAALGFDVDPKKYVMDVNLKPEYNRGIISNVEVAAGTDDRWLGRGFLLGFDDPFRFTLFGNANNVNESRHIGQSGHWTPASAPKSLLTTRSVGGELDFRAPNGKVEETLYVDYASTENESEMNQRKELFLDGSTPLTNLQATSLDKARSLKLHNNLKFLKPFYASLDLDFNHSSFSGNSASLQEQFNDTLTNRLSDYGMKDGSKWNVHGELSGTFPVSKKRRTYMNYSLELTHGRESNEQMMRYTFDKPLADPQHNVTDFNERKTDMHLWLSYGWRTRKKFWFLIDGNLDFQNYRTHDWLYHPDTLLLPSERDALLAITDRSNSYDSHYCRQMYYTSFTVRKTSVLMPDETMPIPYDYNIWELKLVMSPRHQSLDYQRGALDTLATNTSLAFFPSFSVHIFPTKKYSKEITFSASHSIYEPSLQNRITYRDDSQPLVVKLGNPDLKGNESTRLTADYFSRGTHQRLLHVGASFDYFHRATAQSVIYNPQSGVYIYRPENISGNYTAIAKMDYSCVLGEKRLWSVSNNADANYYHSLDHSMPAGMAASEENVVNTLTLHDGAYIQYNKGSLNVRATGDIRWRHSEGKMQDFETLNATDFQYGLSARYTLPRINTTLSADGNMYSRRGYGSPDLNTDDFVLNASVSQPFFKGKLIARIEAFDLLRQLSNTQYSVNAQGRTETWYRSLPHYVMAHLVYHWNKNPKKK